MELEGRWVATRATDDVRRFGIGLDSDDREWSEVSVPGHWQHNAEFADCDGPLMYRHRFDAPPPPEGRRRWIMFDGIFYQGDAWFDGAYLGDSEGYFFPHTFDVTQLSRIGDEHVLAVEVTCAGQSGARTNLTGALQGWEGLPNGWNPGGIWRSVQMFDTGPVRIDRLRVLCRDADERRAHVVLSATFDSDSHHDVVIVTRRDGEIVNEQRSAVAGGMNEFEWSVDVRDPDLWWPRELGDQPLTEFEVDVVIDGESSDRRVQRTGLRQIQRHDWIFSINGERLFLRGVNLMPITVGLGDTDDEAIDRDLRHVVDLGLNAVRVHGHISRRRFYDRADELGLLVLQDFPLEGTHARSVRSRAVSQAAAAVDQLGHHPSIAAWSAHNDGPMASTTTSSDWRTRARNAATQQLPTWNRAVLDRWVKRAFEQLDPSRPTHARSSPVSRLPRAEGTDSHLWFGWRSGEPRDLEKFARRTPRAVRFVSVFGTASVPRSAPVLGTQPPERVWPNVDWDELANDNSELREIVESRFPPSASDSPDAWIDALQRYQAHTLRTQIEVLRRFKYRPTGGFCFSSLADPAPAVSSSVLDHERTPKAAYAAVQAACSPVIVVIDSPPGWVNSGQTLGLDLHIVNDRRIPTGDIGVTVVARWAGGSKRWTFGGSVEADDVAKVGTVELTVPDTLGELSFEVVATDPDGSVLTTNRARTAITLPPD
ncbi:glycoside hydrolase family 2 protein [Ilumatobacter sp.]|uniref:glycoside hydrolase family 2 protein n=1 Tax=Ilumatobacter sp. TaxID=1967498 RepID=UPI003C65EF66